MRLAVVAGWNHGLIHPLAQSVSLSTQDDERPLGARFGVPQLAGGVGSVGRESAQACRQRGDAGQRTSFAASLGGARNRVAGDEYAGEKGVALLGGGVHGFAARRTQSPGLGGRSSRARPFIDSTSGCDHQEQAQRQGGASR